MRSWLIAVNSNGRQKNHRCEGISGKFFASSLKNVFQTANLKLLLWGTAQPLLSVGYPFYCAQMGMAW